MTSVDRSVRLALAFVSLTFVRPCAPTLQAQSTMEAGWSEQFVGDGPCPSRSRVVISQ